MFPEERKINPHNKMLRAKFRVEASAVQRHSALGVIERLQA